MRPAVRVLCLLPVVLLPLRGSRQDHQLRLRRLAHEVAAAEASAPWMLVRFGTPSAEPFEEQGLEVPSDRRGETWVDVWQRAELRLPLRDAAPRVAVLDAASLAGPGPNRADVVLNGRPVAAIDVRPERRRYRIELPGVHQRPGENRLAFVFAAASEPRGPAGRRHAARFYALAVGEVSPALDAIAAPGAPPFSFWPEGEALAQAGPSVLRWTLSPEPGMKLRFRPALHPWSRTAGEPVRLRVTLEQTSGNHELWSGLLDPRRRGGEEVVLDATAAVQDRPLRLGLHVEPAEGRPAWALWRDLELVGPAASSAAAHEVRAPRALGDLRRALAGANVLLVVLDAAGARHFSCYGHLRRTTPEIDRLAAEGVLFERAYTPAPFTLAAMASLWTSLLPDEHHRNVAHDDRLPESVPTLAALLSDHGVRTAGFTANWMAGREYGLDRGFHEFAYVGYRAEKFRAALPAWLARHDDRRFFLYLHYREPHSPYDPGPLFDTLFGGEAAVSREALGRWIKSVNHQERRPTSRELARLEQLYDGNLALADREIGWVRRQLEAAGLWERTVVILTADHGEALYEHGFIGHNEQLYEESLRVPLVMRFPAAAGLRARRLATPVDLLDLAPTVADVFGLPGRAASASFRGRSLLPVALGAPGRGELLARSAGLRPRYALTDGATKFIFDSRSGEEELYDLARDPHERDDLAAGEPLRAGLYRQRLYRLLLELPGRWPGPRADLPLSPRRREELRALGYIR